MTKILRILVEVNPSLPIIPFPKVNDDPLPWEIVVWEYSLIPPTVPLIEPKPIEPDDGDATSVQRLIKLWKYGDWVVTNFPAESVPVTQTNVVETDVAVLTLAVADDDDDDDDDDEVDDDEVVSSAAMTNEQKRKKIYDKSNLILKYIYVCKCVNMLKKRGKGKGINECVKMKC